MMNDPDEKLIPDATADVPERRPSMGKNKTPDGDYTPKVAERAGAAPRPLFGTGSILALVVWGVVVLSVTGAIAGSTALWPLLPVVGSAVPLGLVLLAVWHAKNQADALRGEEIRAVLVSDDRAEREALGALQQSEGLAPAAVAARTSLSVSRASEVLESLAGKGHLDVTAVEGNLVYALRDGIHPSLAGTVQEGSEALEVRHERRGAETVPPKPPIDPLSEREIEVMRLLATGRTNREISQELYVSHGTVKAHTANIYRKLEVHNRAEMINRAKALNLLD